MSATSVKLVKGPHNLIYVMKKIPKSQYLQAKRELRIHGAVNVMAPKLAPTLVYDYIDDTHVNIVMEYCTQGNLLQYSGASEDVVQKKVKEALTLLKSLHSLGIVHNDVKPNNFAIDDKNRMRVIDFGGSFVKDPSVFNFDYLPVPIMYGTPMYMSPERLCGNSCYKSDIWAIGVMCYYLLTKRFPFDDKYNRIQPNVVHVWRSVLEDEVPNVEFLSEHARDFVGSLLKKDTHDRPSAADALCLTWMKEVK